MKRQQWIGLLGAMATLVCGSAFADETVNIGGSRAILIKPNAPRASVILMPGGNGAINAGDHGDIHSLNFNQLVRTRTAYAARGLAVLVVDANTPLDAAVQYMAALKRPVTVIATSRGTLRAAEGDCARRPAERAGADIGIPQRRIGQRPECHVDPRLAGGVAAHARDPSPPG
jgi:hypothetical protein